jgi:hypothetical protein
METPAMTRFVMLTMVAALSLFSPASAAAQWRAADGVTIDEVGDPQYSTVSLCAIDPATGRGCGRASAPSARRRPPLWNTE